MRRRPPSRPLVVRLISPVLATLVPLASLACDPGVGVEVPAPDYDAFERDVYPVLLRDCGFLACHADESRPFRIYGPYRLRADSETEDDAPPTSEEVWLSYQRTRSMLIADDVEQAPLLRKPLPGGGHDGVDSLGRSVYDDASHPAYVVLRQWARGELWYGQR